MPDTTSTSTTPRERRRVEDDATEHGRRRSTHAAAAAGDGERQSGVVADLEHADDLVGRGRAYDHFGELRYLAGERPVQRQWPPVAARLGDRVRASPVPSNSIVSQIDESAAIASSGTSTFVVVSRLSLPSSSIGGVGDVGTLRSCTFLALAQASVRVELSLCLLRRPAQFVAEQRGDRWGGGEAGGPVEQVRAGATHEHIVECGRHLVTNRVDRLGAKVGLAGDEWLARVRVGTR